MDSILVVGTDTTVGANLAVRWAERSGKVTGLGWHEADGGSRPASLEDVRRYMNITSPDRVVLCDAAGEPAWSRPAITDATEAHLRIWSRAVREAGCRFTFLSSDAVFTGPWLFHAEEGTHHCPSLEAGRIRAMEELVLRAVPGALVARTHAFGWSASGRGWIEQWLDALESGRARLDPVPHATPLLASDLTDILERAHAESVEGVLHIAGAERVSQEGFARRLAQQFDLPMPQSAWQGDLAAASTGFACGESSLRTNRVKNLLNLAMPMLGEGLERLADQASNGFRESLRESNQVLQYAA